ncbi:uncharacterized protein LOC139932938 [Centroberyx gerrardi]
MGSCGKWGASDTEADAVGVCTVSTMDSEQRIIQVIREMRSEIRKLELENMGLRRRAGANFRKNATVPILAAEYRKSIVMTVRRYSVFQPLVSHRWNLQLATAKSERWRIQRISSDNDTALLENSRDENEHGQSDIDSMASNKSGHDNFFLS